MVTDEWCVGQAAASEAALVRGKGVSGGGVGGCLGGVRDQWWELSCAACSCKRVEYMHPILHEYMHLPQPGALDKP